ncbi:MAG: acetolactate synthase large subunit [Candidatus Thermoplasmatota archaeon]|jgi:acetolactate synthase-1/2/3 large subunit|nr:acetolactate synthase large subunit [Candidatus Thermoplasmatota archaeon]
MKGSDLFAKALKHESVRHIFGIPGEENIDLLDSISQTDINFILTRHEQGAAFMADAYARVSKKPGVCLSTLGPGATNLLTGVANAHLDRVPLVAITAQAPRDRIHKESHQNVDTIELFSGVTKYNRAVIVGESIPEIVRKAFSSAMKDQPGAAHIQLPEDIARNQVVEQLMVPIPEEAIYEASGKVISSAAELVNSAKLPVILAGNGVIRSSSWNKLRKFAEKTGIPVVNTFMSKGMLPYDHPLNLFTIGGRPFPMELRPLIHSDLVIAVGFDIVEYDPVIWNVDSSRKVINISSTMAEMDEHFPVAFDLVGNIGITLDLLMKKVNKRAMPEEFTGIRERRKQFLESPGKGQEKIPKEILKILSSENRQNTLVISDVGLHKIWVGRYYHPNFPDRTIIYNGFASMGGALPGSVGALMANPGLDVISINGDGGFLMNVQELETAHRLGLSFTAIVFNDRAYSLIEKHQIDAGLPTAHVHFTNPDFSLLAKSFHCDHHLVQDGKDFGRALKESRKASGIDIIEVVIPDMQD